MNVRLQIFMAMIVFGLFAGNAGAATITFDKSLDVPDRTFTFQGRVYDITDVGLYGIGQNIGITINSPGVTDKLVTLYLQNEDYTSPISVWHKTLYGETSTVIPYSEVTAEGQGISGTFGVLVTNKDSGSDYGVIAAKPVIISEYKLLVTPEITERTAGNAINVMVNITKDELPYDVANSIKVEFVPKTGSLGSAFGGNAISSGPVGSYKAKIDIPSSASGPYLAYGAITTDYKIYGDYPETIGAASGGTVSIKGTSTPASIPSSPGGAGGGGSVLSGEKFENIELKESYEKFISKDSLSSYVFRQAGNPVSEVSITSTINAGDVAVKIEVLRGLSSLVSSPASGIVYKNINIIVGKSGFAVPQNIKEAIIKFRVENSWITTNDLASSDVTMVRWDGSQWAQIHTSETNSDATYTYFEAKTDSFSSFAITGLKEVVVPTATPEIMVTEKGTPIETPLEAPPTEKEAPGFEASVTILTVTLLASSLIRGDKRR